MLSKKQHGFTLTELMIVVAVLAILAGIAIPSYSHFTKKAQLRKAQAALLENAHALEQAYTQKKRFFDASKKLEITLPNESVGDPAKFAHVEQITGAIARRIECWVHPNEDIKQNRRLGLVRFGSQVAVYMPKDTVRVVVKEGQKVQGGITVLALWK